MRKLISLDLIGFPLRCHEFKNRTKLDIQKISWKWPNFTIIENHQKWSFEVGIRLMLTAETSWTQKNRFGVVPAYYPSFMGRFAIFFDFSRKFREFRKFWKTDFFDFRVRKFFSKMIFHQILYFSLKLWYFLAQFWYNYIHLANSY